ncbi:MAG: DEAD/DEAH box helicase [Candidatus Saccharimonadales bacterium]
MSNYAYRSSRSHRPNNRRSNRGGRGGNYKQKIDINRFIKSATVVEEGEYKSVNSFSDFNLHSSLQQAITKKGFTQPSPIQDQAIPYVLEGRDIVGIANTGTGKTAAFLLPLINKLLADPRQQVLIMAPTRELALQIQDEFKEFTPGMRLYSTLCIGGTPIHRQINDLRRNPHVVIGTPGRLKDLIERRVLKLHQTKSVVLDEVDRMVDMGFINDLKVILSELPKDRQSLFLTATVPSSVEMIMHSFLRDPVTIKVKTGETADNIEQNIIRVNGGNKIDKLHQLLETEELEKVLVFGETKRGVENLARTLNEKGVSAVSIHGNKSQGQRQRALAQFRSNQASVLVATDVAARGLDITDITHVINYDTPQTYNDYVHRIGRAGRAGKPGSALTFVG